MFVALVIAGHAIGAPQLEDASPLSGIKKAVVSSHVSGAAAAGQDAPVSGERFQTILELRLRTAGIKVLTAAEDAVDLESNPIIQFRGTLVRLENNSREPRGWALAISLEVRERALYRRNGSVVHALSWQDETLAVSGPDNGTAYMEGIASQMIDRLLNAWLKANPR